MAKTYSITRKINLGKYGERGLRYEAIDIGIEGASSFREAAEEMKAIKDQVQSSFAGEARIRLAELNAKAKLTFAEEEERLNLSTLDRQAELPF